MTFTENWFPHESQMALAALAGSTLHLEGLIVEVGSWEGRSTCALARAVAPEVVHAVDTWQGSPGEVSAALAAERDVYGTFLANVEETTAGNVMPHRMGWRDWFAANTSPIRFLFIDAEHTYTEVHDNLLAALPHMTPGGVVCGDDVHHPPVMQAVTELFPNVNVAATLWWLTV